MDRFPEYYLRLSVDDRPGVLAQIAGALGESGIGILSVIQPESHSEGSAVLVLMIHDAPFGPMRNAVEKIASLRLRQGSPQRSFTSNPYLGIQCSNRFTIAASSADSGSTFRSSEATPVVSLE